MEEVCRKRGSSSSEHSCRGTWGTISRKRHLFSFQTYHKENIQSRASLKAFYPFHVSKALLLLLIDKLFHSKLKKPHKLPAEVYKHANKNKISCLFISPPQNCILTEILISWNQTALAVTGAEYPLFLLPCCVPPNATRQAFLVWEALLTGSCLHSCFSP